MQNLNRRRFLGAAVGTGAAAAAAGSLGPHRGRAGRPRGVQSAGAEQPHRHPALHDAQDHAGGDRQSVRRILNFLGANGYSEVETAGYWGFTAAQLRSWLDSAGLRAASGHDP